MIELLCRLRLSFFPRTQKKPRWPFNWVKMNSLRMITFCCSGKHLANHFTVDLLRSSRLTQVEHYYSYWGHPHTIATRCGAYSTVVSAILLWQIITHLVNTEYKLTMPHYSAPQQMDGWGWGSNNELAHFLKKYQIRGRLDISLMIASARSSAMRSRLSFIRYQYYLGRHWLVSAW